MIRAAVANLCTLPVLTEPGGWLQWEEYDHTTTHAIASSPKIPHDKIEAVWDELARVSPAYPKR